MRHPRPRRGDEQRKIPTDWGKVAEWYDQLVGEEGSEFHREIIFPGVMRLLNPQPGEAILDVACGQGAFCRILAQRGVRVVGVDASAELIKLARQHNAALGTSPAAVPEYHVGDARDLSFLPPAHYAGACCILAIQNIDQMSPVFEGISRALVTQGRLILVMMHPCFRGPKFSSWGWDEESRIQYRRVDRYLLPRKEPIFAHPGKKTGEYTWTFHRPIQAYVKALRGAGLVVDAMEEWASHKRSTSGPRAAAENTARKEIPLFLAVRALKVGLAKRS